MYLYLGLLILAYCSAPVLIISGWMRYIRQSGMKSSLRTLISFAVSTCSGLLALGTVIYSGLSGGFAYYDPVLMRIFRWGLLLSLVAWILAIAGVRKPQPLRWHALGSSSGMLLMWFLWAGME